MRCLERKKEEAHKNFKIRAKALLKNNAEFVKFKKQKQKEFDDAITNKMKEFNKEMQDTFSLLENVEKMKSEFLLSVPGSTEIKKDEK